MDHEGRYPGMAWMSLGVGLCMGVLLSRSRIFRTLFPSKAEPGFDVVTTATAGRKAKCEEFADFKERFKVVFAARTDLKMSAGKIGAQCGHAAVGLYKSAFNSCPKTLKRWERYGQPKVVLKVSSEDEMNQLERHAREKGLLTTIIHDAGHTQVAAGSATVLGIGPGPTSVIDSVTGNLKLY